MHNFKIQVQHIVDEDTLVGLEASLVIRRVQPALQETS